MYTFFCVKIIIAFEWIIYVDSIKKKNIKVSSLFHLYSILQGAQKINWVEKIISWYLFTMILLYLFQNPKSTPTLSSRPILRPHCISSIDYTVEHRKLTVSAGNFNGPDSGTKAQRDFCTMYKYARCVIARPQGERESRAIRDGRLFNKHAPAGSRHGAQGYYTCRSRC